MTEGESKSQGEVDEQFINDLRDETYDELSNSLDNRLNIILEEWAEYHGVPDEVAKNDIAEALEAAVGDVSDEVLDQRV